MKTMRIAVFIVVALAQLCLPASVLWTRQRTLSQGRVWKFKTAPVDPVDAMRGRYIALRFTAEAIPTSEAPKDGHFAYNSFVYVILKEDADGFAMIDHVSTTPLKGDNVVRAEVDGWWDKAQHVRFPFNRLWVSEKVAPQAEAVYLANSRRDKQNAYVTVRVRDGDAGLEQLYIDGQPLVDYLRAHAVR